MLGYFTELESVIAMIPSLTEGRIFVSSKNVVVS